MLSSKSGWCSSGALSSLSLSGLTNSRNYRRESSPDSSSNVNLLQESNEEASRMESGSASKPLKKSSTLPNGYNLSEQTFALNFHVESCMDSDNDEDDDSNNDAQPLKGDTSDAKRDTFLRPPGHEAWWDWDNIGDLHPAHTQPLFYSVQEESETLQSVAAKFKITPSELKRLNRLSEDFIFVGQKLRVRN